MFALPGLTAAGNVHRQLPVNSAFFYLLLDQLARLDFSSTPLSALQEPLPFPWPLSVPKTFLKGAFTSYLATLGFNGPSVMKNGGNFNTSR